METSGGDNELNSTPWTVMTYNDATSEATSINTTGDNIYLSPRSSTNYGYLQTLGAFDIATAQYLYGVNTSYNSGDNEYALNGNANGYTTIWDNGGHDTINADSASQPVVIDLRNATLKNEPGGGGFVSRHGNQYIGYTIAFNTTGNCIIENAIGSNLSDNITGNSVGNLIDGRAGADIMAGGQGNDTYVVDNDGDIVTEAADSGIDLISSEITYETAENVENLTLTGSNNINATGNDLANILNGNSANNILNGKANVDTMAGGEGDDTYYVDNGLDVVNELANQGKDQIFSSTTYTLPDNIENIGLTGSLSINATGNTLDNFLRGNIANNTLIGNSGNDGFHGGDGGVDIMIGGPGDDTYLIESSTDQPIERIGKE